MNQIQMDQFLDEIKFKLPFAKFVVRNLKNGKKVIFYNRSFYSKKCTQFTVTINDNDEVRINFIYWPRYWAKVRIIKIENLSSPDFKNWLQSKITEGKIHLTSPIGFSQLSLN